MRKLHLFSTLVALSLATTSLWAVPTGTVNGGFSVSATKKVYFSQGNLQYQASTDTWRFAEKQYNIVGNAPGNTTATDRDKQADWIDYFGWGTKSNPWNTSSNSADYSWQGDWGENVISNGGNAGQPTMWRTLTNNDCVYLFNVRTGDKASTVNGSVDIRYAKATVNGVTGLILFPDGGTFAADEFDYVSNLNSQTALYTSTTCTSTQWTALEGKGCVFLPAAGERLNTSMYNVGITGSYWTSSTAGSTALALSLSYGSSGVYVGSTNVRNSGSSVRLVQNAPAAEVNPAPAANTLYYTGSAQELVIAGTAIGGTMQYKSGSGEWTTDIPTGTDVGNYTVYYKAVGDATHSDSEEASLIVTINNPKATISNPPTAKDPLIYTGSPLELIEAGSGVSGGTLKYSLDGETWSTDIPTATALGDYTVYWKVEGDASHSDYIPVPNTIAVSITIPTITDHSDAATINAVFAINPTTLKLERTIYADDEYNTICLPFALDASAIAASPLNGYNRLKAFRGAQVSGTGASTNIDIFVEDATAIEAGVPYLISYPSAHADIVNPVFSGITVTTTEPGNVEADGVTFQGMFAQVHIDQHNGTKDYLFLGENSQLYWPLTSENGNESVKMRGFRAYFIIDRNAIPAHVAPRGTHARFVNAPQIITSIDNSSAKFGGSEKIIENGILYIILKNGIRYNAQGQIVK